GTSTVRASFTGIDYYLAGSDDATVAVAKATRTVHAFWLGWTYHGTAPLFPYTALFRSSPAVDVGSPAATFAYYPGSDTSGTALAGAPTDAGTYTVRASFAGNDNYQTGHDDATVAVAKATPTVHAVWSGWTYDGTAHPASATVKGVGSPAVDVGSPAATFAYYPGSDTSGTAL